jgi:DNA-binding PadR family transcriptional regulator
MKDSKVGRSGTRPKIGLYQIQIMRMILKLGARAYGAEIERQLAAGGIDTNRGQVHQACTRLEERKFLSSKAAPEPGRETHKVKVYAVTAEGKRALEHYASF